MTNFKEEYERGIEILEETGSLAIEGIDDLGWFMEELKKLGYDTHLDDSTDYLILDK